MRLFWLNILLAVAFSVWAGSVWAGPGAWTLMAGFVAGYGLLWLACRATGSRVRYFRMVIQAVVLSVYFAKELVLSSVRVARDALARRPALVPGIVRMPLDTDNDIEIFLLSSLITLTPGTLTLDVAADKSFLIIHSLYAADHDALVAELRSGMGHRVREVFR